MTPYIESILETDEFIEYQAQLSSWSLWFWLLVGYSSMCISLLGLIRIIEGVPVVGPFARITFFCFLIGSLFIAIAKLKQKTTELIITNKKLVAKTGIISRKTFELQLANIESVEVRQSIFGRLANYGTVYSLGRGNSRVPVSGIYDPILFRKKVSEIRAKYGFV